MTTWVVISWVFVALLTGVNVFVFLKLKKASDQMMKMAFPNAKNMSEALSQMQGMLSSAKRGAPGRMPAASMSKNQSAQLQSALNMLKSVQK